MTYEELEHNELERMKYNAFKVCDELSLRIDGAAGPNNYMKAYTSQKSEDLFFNNHANLKKYLAASEKNRVSLPGSHYFKLLQGFIQSHFEIGEKYIEFLRHSCSACPCFHCAEFDWAGPVCSRIPKPFPNYNANGMHYLDVPKTPVEEDGKIRAVHDFQPRKQCKDYLREGKLSTEEDRESFSNRFSLIRCC